LHFVETVQSAEVIVPALGVEEAIATCPAGKIAVGGGFSTSGFDQSMEVTASNPQPEGNAWRVVARNPGTGDGTLVASVVCAEVG
jgi:hypothetical protein